MSTISHQITGATTRIDKCCDPESMRFAIGGILVTPRSPDTQAVNVKGVRSGSPATVFLTATDTRILAVTTAEGTASAPAMMPPQMIAKRKAKRSFTPAITLNGEWRVSDTVAPANSIEGRFPRAESVLPHVDGETCLVVSFNADYLAKLAAGITTDGCVTLHIGIPQGKRFGMGSDSPIAVMGDAGFGVLMPHAAGDEPRELKCAAYRAAVEEYRAAMESVKDDALRFAKPE